MTDIHWTVWRVEDGPDSPTMDRTEERFADARAARAEMVKQVEYLIAGETEENKTLVRAELAKVSLSTITGRGRWKEWTFWIRPMRGVRVVVVDHDRNQDSIL